MKNIKNIFKFFLVSLLILSCSKDDEVTPVPKKTYLSKRTIASIGTYTLNYDDQGKLINEVFASSNEAANSSFTYTVKSYEGNKIKTATYDYTNPTRTDADQENRYNNAGKLIGIYFYNVNTTVLASSTTIEYTGPTEIRSTTRNSTNLIINYEIITFDSNGKNIIEIKRYNATDVLQSTTTFSNFDNKINPFTLLPIGYGRGIMSQNNEGTTINTPASGASSTFTYTYDYNEDGFATKRTSASGAINTFEFIKF